MKPYIKRIRIFILLQILFDIICTILSAFTPILQKWLFDDGIYGGINKIITIVTIYIAIQILNVISVYLCMLFTWKGAVKFEYLLKQSFFKSVFRMENEEFSKKPIGGYISLQGNDITALEQDYLQPWIDVIRSVNMFIIYGVILFVFVDWRIALTILLLSFLTALGPKLTGNRLAGKRNIYQKQLAIYVTKITDLLEGFHLINDKTRENITMVHEESLQKTADERYSFGKEKSLSLSLNDLSIKLIQIASFAAAGILLAKGEITIGTGIATFSYTSSFLEPINSILYDVNAIQSMKEIKKNFLSYVNIPKKTKSISFSDMKDRISFKNARYQYENFKLDNVSIDFEKGKKYAVIGSSGSGKSTLLKLLMGYMPLSGGVIQIDDMNLCDGDISNLISYIDQSDHIYRAGYLDNATVFASYPSGRLHHRMEKFVEQQITMIKTLKNSENCQDLSGGEKQLLSFLRILTKDTPVLLMDEPFSAIDLKTRKHLENYLFHDKDMEDKTLIVITHNIDEALLQYDKVILMKDGRIAAIDKYENLSQSKEFELFVKNSNFT